MPEIIEETEKFEDDFVDTIDARKKAKTKIQIQRTPEQIYDDVCDAVPHQKQLLAYTAAIRAAFLSGGYDAVLLQDIFGMKKNKNANKKELSCRGEYQYKQLMKVFGDKKAMIDWFVSPENKIGAVIEYNEVQKVEKIYNKVLDEVESRINKEMSNKDLLSLFTALTDYKKNKSNSNQQPTVNINIDSVVDGI